MESHEVKILSVEPITHNVKRIRVQRPEGYDFIPGQATDVSIPDNPDDLHPFTFTGLREWEFLEFSIKIYNDRNGLTAKIGRLNPGDSFILHDVWGAINYKGTGVFIAGGAGVTPFIAILRDLYRKNELKGNKLFFSNKTKEDIILREEFEKMLGEDFYNTLTKEKTSEYRYGKFDLEFFRENFKDFTQHFYVCGPDAFVADITKMLQTLGANPEAIVFEK